jgi:PQQ-dependent dehydrogenase (methanol/ethanol family)
MAARRRYVTTRLASTACAAVLLVAGVLPGLAQTAAVTPDPNDANWPIAPKNYASTRYSSLDQITADNVRDLKLAWTFSLGIDRGQEAAPIVVDGTMYVVSPFPNKVFALNAATGELKWTYTPSTDPASQGVACCDVVNRGVAYAGGRIFFNTLDNHTVALDAETGEEVWVTKLGDINLGETMTMAPLPVKDKLLVGNSGGEMGVRGWVTALNQSDGKIAWRAHGTGPDEDVLIGEDFKPFYDFMKGEDLGVKTWPADHWQIGGATMWGWISYDPDLDLVYYGTGNPGPWNAEQRPGDNLWASTLFARDPDDGSAKWAYQFNPHDLWDHDEVNENIILDLDMGQGPRKVVIHIGRNGYMYVMDRQTGEVISADPYDTVNAYKGVDLKTGRIIPNEELHPAVGKTIENVCPAPPGAKDWQPSAWSPQTRLLYVPHQHLCMNFRPSEVGYIAGTPFVGATVDMYAGPGGHRGEFMAWDPVKRQKVWAILEKFPVWSGTVVTAGNVAFYGTMDRMFKAVDARDGRLLWQFRAGSGFIGQPTTFLGTDGRQYVAILAGVGGWPGVVASAEIDPQVRNGALGFTGAMQDLPAYTAGGSDLLVFSLPGEPQQPSAPPPSPAPDPVNADAPR